MRVSSLIIATFVFFITGALLTFLFPFSEASAGSGQSHPPTEITCTTDLCVQSNFLGIGTTSPDNLLTVEKNGGQVILRNPSAVSGSSVPFLHFRYADNSNPSSNRDWILQLVNGNFYIGDDISILPSDNRQVLILTPRVSGTPSLQVIGTTILNGPFRLGGYEPSNLTIFTAATEKSLPSGGQTCTYKEKVKAFRVPGFGRYRIAFDIYRDDADMVARLTCDGMPCSNGLTAPVVSQNGINGNAPGNGWIRITPSTLRVYLPTFVDVAHNFTALNSSFEHTVEVGLDVYLCTYYGRDKLKNARLAATFVPPATQSPGVTVD